MSEDNKRNLHYFEARSMRELFDVIDAWQVESRKRLLSLNVERDGAGFCCIALTNPTEVIIMDGSSNGGAYASSTSGLQVFSQD